MSVDLVIRVLCLCIVLAGMETLHGIARAVWLVPRIGKRRALQLSVFTGSALAFAICAWWVPGLGFQSLPAHLLLGLILALFMAAFDAALGRWLLRRPWRKVLQDFNPATGNWLLYGLLLLSLWPAWVWVWVLQGSGQ